MKDFKIILTIAASLFITFNCASQSRDDKKIISAAKKGDLKKVVMYLEKGVSPDTKNLDGENLLNIAVINNHFTIVQTLLAKGAKVNYGDNNGLTPLHFASFKGYTPIAQLLLEKGANVNIVDKTGLMPLHFASIKGSTATVQLLLEKGANVNSGDKNGLRPLHFACLEGHTTIVQLLLEKNAIVNISDNRGRPPLLAATSYGRKEIVDLLKTHGASGVTGTTRCDFEYYGLRKGMTIYESEKIIGPITTMPSFAFADIGTDLKPITITNNNGTFVFERGPDPSAPKKDNDAMGELVTLLESRNQPFRLTKWQLNNCQ